MSDHRIMLAAALALLLTTTPVLAAERPDAWVTTKAKIALLTTDGVSGTAINVDTVAGRVTLHGKVPTDAEKAKAAATVEGIEGVREVRNLLQVVPASAREKVDASDVQIAERVRDALAKDAAVADSGVEVRSVNEGVVLLSGDAPNMTVYLRALRTAAAVPGVTRVASQVQTADRLADERPMRTDARDAAPATVPAPEAAPAPRPAADRGIADTASDAYVTAATKMRLLANRETPALDINVDTVDGHVTLFGIVPTEAAKRTAETEARKVHGVRSVENDLQVVASERQEAVASRDADVEDAVEQALDRRTDIPGDAIDVEVKDGVVRLTGTVPSEQARITAATAARSASGVRAVLGDGLEVRGDAR